MIIRHTEEDTKKYRDSLSLNQSSIKVILSQGFQAFQNKAKDYLRREKDDLYFEDKRHFNIGSGVDVKISMGEEGYEAQFFQLSQIRRKPSAKLMSILNSTYDKVIASSFAQENGVMAFIQDYASTYLAQAMNEHQFRMHQVKEDDDGVVTDTRFKTITKDDKAQAYWSALVSSAGRTIISEEENTTINNVYISLTNHTNTAHLFKDSDDITIIYQLPLYFTWDGVECKALLDMVIINHTTKTIRIVDIKTMSKPVLLFNKAVWDRRYDIQGSFYLEAFKMNLITVSDLVGKDIINYKISAFAFVVESTTSIGTPLIFPLKPELLEVGKKGNGDYAKGWEEAVQVYKRWQENLFDIENIVADAKGVIWINQDYEYLKQY